MTHAEAALYLAITALVCVNGYILGRVRPWEQLTNWAINELRFGDDRLARSKVRQAILLAVLLLTQPRHTISGFCHRHDPEEPPYGLSVISTDDVNHLKGDHS